MTQSPIPKVLSTLLKHEVKTLLIGGQARILYALILYLEYGGMTLKG